MSLYKTMPPKGMLICDPRDLFEQMESPGPMDDDDGCCVIP